MSIYPYLCQLNLKETVIADIIEHFEIYYFMNKRTFSFYAKCVAVCGLLFGLTLASCGNNNGQQQAQAAPNIAVTTLKRESVHLESVYPTIIKGKKDVEIRPQVTAFITRVCVDEGQQVAAGQTLFILDQVQYEAAVRQAEAAVAVAQESVNSASITAENKQKLFNKNIISEYENTLAKNDLAQAKAQLAQAQASLVTARKNLSFTVVKAPSAGYVGSIPNREGSLASPTSQTPLTTISDISEVYAYISFNEKQVLEMTDGGKKSLSEAINALPEVKLVLSDGTAYPLPGKISTLTGLLDNTTGSASARILFKNQNGMLRSGSTGTIVIPIQEDSVLLVPQKATTEIQDIKYAYVVNDSNKVTATKIEVLANNDGKNYVVTNGLKEGDRIVVEGVGVKVKNGSIINPVEQKAQQ